MKKILASLALVAAATSAQAYDCQGSYNNIGQAQAGFEMDIYPGGGVLILAQDQVVQTELTHVGYVGNHMVFRAWSQRWTATCTPRGVILEDEFGGRQLLRPGSWVMRKGVVPKFKD